MTDASMARPGVDDGDDSDVGLVTVFDVGDAARLLSLTVAVESLALARRRRRSRRGLGAICGRGLGDNGDATLRQSDAGA